MLRIMKLDSHMNNLAVEMERLLESNKTVRSELGRNWGYKGKVNTNVLDWLDNVERIERQFIDVLHTYISLLGLVKFIPISSSSVLVFFDSITGFEEYRFSVTLPTLRAALADKIKEKIWEYLDDPLIIAISFCGGEGGFKRGIIKQLQFELTHSSHKIARVELFKKTNLKDSQHHIATELNVHMRENQDAKVNKCVLIFDDVHSRKPELFNRVLSYTHSRYSAIKINKCILKLANEVKIVVKSYSSLHLLYDEDGVDRVLGKFTTRQTLIGKSAQEVLANMWEFLLDSNIATIGLYGVAGVGKTTIIKNICNELANTNIFDKIIWVSMSKTKLVDDGYMRLQDAIAKQLGIKLPGFEMLKERASRISEKLKNLGKYIFIFDDVWEKVGLEDIGILYPLVACACKIVLTTRFRYVCTLMRADEMIHLLPLSENKAWDLFVSNSGKQVLQPGIKTIAKQIVYECWGLPITIITVSHAMKGMVKFNMWRLALKDLRSSNSRIYGEGMDHLFDVLKFGYNHLMNDQVRACFLCCAIFPEDYKFDPTELIRYWMAESLINNEGGIAESMNDGAEILKELTDANMLEIFVEGGIEWLIMHDLFRDLAITVMRVELDFIVKAGIGEQKISNTGNEKISLIRNRILHLDPLHNPCTNISTLLLRENPLYYIPYSFFCSMPNLQVLDMSYSGLKQLPLSLSELSKLRVLFLDFCTGLEKLPSLGSLKNLRFFSLRGTLIKELPQGIEGLVNLRSLDLSETVRLEHIKIGAISSLSNLEELHLQGSRLCKMGSPEVANLFKEIMCLKKLGILTLSSVGFGNPLDTILHLQQYNLKIFSVNAYGSALDYIEDE